MYEFKPETNREKVEVVRIVNPAQAGAYANNGLEPLRIYFNKDKWVWEFDKEKSRPYFTKWLNHDFN